MNPLTLGQIHFLGPMVSKKNRESRKQMSAPSPSRYEIIYGVGLLDDLHNYFPALLYDHSRFQTVTQIFHYIRYQMNTRFNLYAVGARQAGLRQEEAGPSETAATPVRAAQRAGSSLAATSFLLDLLNLGLTNQNEDNVFFTTNTVTGTRTPAQLWTSFRQPVVVRPTDETIAQTTTVVQGTTLPPNTTCAICQEGITVTDTARKINHCDHLYHQSCIDQWFQRSVQCPTCRFDIRDSLRPSRSS